MDKPLISVYITNHNYGHYVKKAIESVLSQSMSDFELIIIDDGSTDNSRKVIESFSEEDRVKIIYQKNKGLNVSNNIAMRTARGKYIMRLDADDYLDHNALLVLSNALEKDQGIGLVFPDYFLIDENDQILGIEKRHHFEKDVKLLDQPAHGACTMIRRSYLLELSGYDENYSCQDGYELWIKFIDKYKIKNIHTPLFYYRQHGNNLTRNEERILQTRIDIKRDFIQKQERKPLQTLAIIPIRGEKNSKYNLVFESLDHEKYIDYKIKETLKAKSIFKTIITTADTGVIEYVNDKYKACPDIFVHRRDPKLARMNIGLTDTVTDILSLQELEKFTVEAIMILAFEFPFVTSNIIDDAVHTMMIFKADSMITVRPETSLIYQHNGQGMHPILNQEKFSKLEREALYKYTGGLSLTDIHLFKKTAKLIGGKVSHVIIDQKAAHGVFSEYDLQLAKFLAEK
jgi:glycosyltransferase involved in cell wall biosynthesis